MSRLPDWAARHLPFAWSIAVLLLLAGGLLWWRDATLTPRNLARMLADQPMPARPALTATDTLSRGIPKIGAQRLFHVMHMDDGSPETITATLLLQGEHVQMWVQNDLTVDLGALVNSASVFDQRIYPTNRRCFGHEPSPGIDGDPRLWVLNADIRGAAGYFTSVNTRPKSMEPLSNEADMFVMNVTSYTPGSAEYEGVLAHEFQHMIHWSHDADEDTWLTEGMSELAEELSGFGPPSYEVELYAAQPDIQLNTWGDEPGHYGASYLFVRWLWQYYGDEMLRDLVADPRNGIASISHWLEENTNTSLDDVFADWVVDMWSSNGPADLGSDKLTAQRHVAVFPYAYNDTVHQFGMDALALTLPDEGKVKVTFEAEDTVRLVPIGAHSGKMQWWSNRGDMGHSVLQRTVDLRHVSQAEFTYWLWYDIEQIWDYAYLRVSADGGQTWALLRGQQMVSHPLHANAAILGVSDTVGYGYTGRSWGDIELPPGDKAWHYEMIDLTAYAGQEIMLSFDYITDDAMNRPGLGLDDLAIDAVGFRDDVERERGWQSSGFLRHNNRLPQTFSVLWLPSGSGQYSQRLNVRSGRGSWQLGSNGDHSGPGLLLISALAPVTTETAHYYLDLEQLP